MDSIPSRTNLGRSMTPILLFTVSLALITHRQSREDSGRPSRHVSEFQPELRVVSLMRSEGTPSSRGVGQTCHVSTRPVKAVTKGIAIFSSLLAVGSLLDALPAPYGPTVAGLGIWLRAATISSIARPWGAPMGSVGFLPSVPKQVPESAGSDSF